MRKFFVLTAFAFLCLSCSTQATQSQQSSSSSVTSPSSFEAAALTDSFETNSLVKAVKPAPSSVSMSLGPELLEVKASYLEKRDQTAAVNGLWREEKVQRYLNVLGTSLLGGSGFIGEAELTYSPLDAFRGQNFASEWPKTLRVGVKNRWQDVGFGADYKAIDRGFLSITGERTEQARDEGQVWAERIFGPVKLRGSVGQSWEQSPDSRDMRITRSATASFNLTRAQWAGSLTSSYALIEPATVLDSPLGVITNSLTGSYRPFSSLALVPSFSLRQEWNRNSGARTESPSTAFSFAYTPAREAYKITGGTSFSRSLSAAGSKDLTTVTTAAMFDWKLGGFLGKEDLLSFNVNYNHQLDEIVSPRYRANFLGMLQFKVTGF